MHKSYKNIAPKKNNLFWYIFCSKCERTLVGQCLVVAWEKLFPVKAELSDQWATCPHVVVEKPRNFYHVIHVCCYFLLKAPFQVLYTAKIISLGKVTGFPKFMKDKLHSLTTRFFSVLYWQLKKNIFIFKKFIIFTSFVFMHA